MLAHPAAAAQLLSSAVESTSPGIQVLLHGHSLLGALQAGIATVHLLHQGLSPLTIVPLEAQKAVLGCSWVQVSSQEGVGEGKGRGFECGGSSWNAHLTEVGGKI